MKRFILSLLLVVVLMSGCTRDESIETDVERAKLLCIQECQKALGEGRDLSNGPCLSDEIIEDWVCDVVHSPREDVDDDPANQCEAFRKGRAHHFVEVDPECNFIKAY